MNYKDIWQNLSAIDCTAHVEKKNGLSYLSWAWAWGTLMKYYPEATYSFDAPQVFPDQTQMVFCTVNIGECSRRMWLPVMDHRNKAIQNPDAFATNTAMMRCLVKCLALYGLGHYIYAGEDLPQSELERLYSPISEHQHQELVGMIASLDGDIDMPAFLRFFGISVLSNMKQSDYQKAKAALEAKILKSKGVANASD
jgi:hypothetical protein